MKPRTSNSNAAELCNIRKQRYSETEGAVQAPEATSFFCSFLLSHRAGTRSVALAEIGGDRQFRFYLGPVVR